MAAETPLRVIVVYAPAPRDVREVVLMLPPACTVLQSCANTSAIDACRRAGHSSGRQRQAVAVAVAGPLRPTAPCNL